MVYLLYFSDGRLDTSILIKDVKQPILLVVEQERLKEAVTRLARVGFDNIIGYLDGGIEPCKQFIKQFIFNCFFLKP